MNKAVLLVFSVLLFSETDAQDYRWQQRAEYTMDVHLDVKTHKLKGTQKLVYHNNSSDTLDKVYYHLYFNAFQPGSMMDVRSRNLPDPDKRVTDRISKLKADEVGYQHITTLKQDGVETKREVRETILIVILPQPILPHTTTTFEMEFEAQVPLQIRRTGRDSAEGIDYSMAQWYPKLAEYDFQGWHAYPYVAREFHGVWGDFDVTISLDNSYMVAGTGVLQNANEIGYGYDSSVAKKRQRKGNTTWHFVAKNVHDFVWAADPDYKHDIAQVPDGPTLHFFYQPGNKTTENWNKLQGYAVKHFQYMNDTYGAYPYEVFSVIQGGDGGMEYPMCTLMTGEKSLGSLVGTMVHEVSHSWFHGVLASNEMLYHWMDEGFTDFVSHESMADMFKTEEPAHKKSYTSYVTSVKRGLHEPASQAADYFSTNRGYTNASYAAGAIFLWQLKYIVGNENFHKGMRRYYETWKFRHPQPNDFLRIMEKTSGLELRWYYNYWINSTKHIDYGIEKIIEQEGDKSIITLKRVGELPMPTEVLITLSDGTQKYYYIPLNEMLGRKPKDSRVERIDLEYWPWVNPTYEFTVDHEKTVISKIEIDPNNQTADIDTSNNVLIPRQ